MKQSKTYTTISGDTWDLIAYKVYGYEHFCDKLMDANREYLDIMVFPDGVTLTIPHRDTFVADTVLSDQPNWRALMNG